MTFLSWDFMSLGFAACISKNFVARNNNKTRESWGQVA